MQRPEVEVESLSVSTYRIPTDYPESDGTLEWNSTTLVIVEIEGGSASGLGYTYADTATSSLIDVLLAPLVTGSDALDITSNWSRMLAAIRNLGRPGIASMAIAAVDSALWDLKARVLGLSLVDLLGGAHENISVYGSGGFTSYAIPRLCEQLAGWAGQGIGRVKMKVGREPLRDPARVSAAREAIGPHVELFVDANGAYSRKQALALAFRFAEAEVTWFEEPVSSDDLEGLCLMRNRVPAAQHIAAGEYGYDSTYFRRMLEAEAVDVLQADASRCAGVSGFMRVAALCEAHGIPLSAHCCPALHLPLCCAAPRAVHLEYFHDHVRIERMMFDGVQAPVNGRLTPDRSRPGMGLELKRRDAEKFRI